MSVRNNFLKSVPGYTNSLRQAGICLEEDKGKGKVRPKTGHEGPEGK